MSVISLEITESNDQIVSGIPRLVSITSNISSIIFYTLDGTDPDINSIMYVSPIQMPTNISPLTLKVFATDGASSSSISSITYQTSIVDQNARLPHSATTAPANPIQTSLNLAPFGSPPITPNSQFLNPAEAGLTVDNPLLPEVSTAFDADGYPAAFTNGPTLDIPTQQFPFIYSESDNIGQRGPGIGTLPPSSFTKPKAPPERSDMNSRFFDPRALVLIQDLTQPIDPNMPVHINRMATTLENLDVNSAGNNFYGAGPDAQAPSGHFLRQHFNPTNNTMTYYYYDSHQNRWIISIMPYTPKPDQHNYASKMVLRKGGPGARFVYGWFPWKGSYLY